MKYAIDPTIIAGLVAAAVILFFVTTMTPALPKCPEDSLIRGVGTFDNGHWSGYECGPAADDVR